MTASMIFAGDAGNEAAWGKAEATVVQAAETATATAAKARETAPVAEVPATTDLASAKAALRSLAREARAAMAPEERERKSALICERAAALFDGEAERRARAAGGESESLSSQEALFTLAVYATLRDEVSLEGLVRHAYERGWRVCFPAMLQEDGEDGEGERCDGRSGGTKGAGVGEGSADGAGNGGPAEPMAFFSVGFSAYERGEAPFVARPIKRFSRSELVRAGYGEVTPKEIDGIVVPLLAFDDRGGRLGYGGGNYDRYLPRLRREARVAGVAFCEQRVSHVPREPFDRLLPCVIVA